MFKKLTGIIILLSFLLVKSTPLFAMDNHTYDLIACCSEQGTDDTPDTEKGSQQLEITDEDFTGDYVVVPGFLMLLKTTTPFNDPRINTPYISLPYPPPNVR
ncbi:hypothetical protein [Pedobacter nyackensis]|uniref:hypothetical protein n=1 Tax=Pedobacter nyackensis TaxID=475255 RepID=UPI00292F09E5|nr:hypothetical protein [Pedobacter nyackensis]